MTMPSSVEVELVDKCADGEYTSRGGGDGDDRQDAELLLPGEVPPHESAAKDKNKIKSYLFLVFLDKRKVKNVFFAWVILTT